MVKTRKSGLLLHITSLPSRFGIGDLGPEAYRFVDFLEASQQTIWQILPLTPTQLKMGNSPYSSPSAFAGNPLLISPERLVADNLIPPSALDEAPTFVSGKIDFPSVTNWKLGLLRTAFTRFETRTPDFESLRQEYSRFCEEHRSWLENYVLFCALKEKFNDMPWGQWPSSYRSPETASSHIDPEVTASMEAESFRQFLFFRQFDSLKKYCSERGILLMGDIPIYVNLESADVWAHQSLFKLTSKGRPQFQAGVPPDYFSETGQLWGNPVYDWKAIQADQFTWWLDRVSHNLALYDTVRIDHFRGLVSYWEVPGSDKTAMNGYWEPVPVTALLDAIQKRHPDFPLIAEDLGVITDDVKETMERFQIPGMKVLLFAFGDGVENNPYSPHHHIPGCVLYVGTHDNNTARGWFEVDASPQEKRNLETYLGHPVEPDSVSQILVRLAMMSIADTVVLACQDLLDLGSDARMNRPGTKDGNWDWRLLPDQLGEAEQKLFSDMTYLYQRQRTT